MEKKKGLVRVKKVKEEFGELSSENDDNIERTPSQPPPLERPSEPPQVDQSSRGPGRPSTSLTPRNVHRRLSYISKRVVRDIRASDLSNDENQKALVEASSLLPNNNLLRGIREATNIEKVALLKQAFENAKKLLEKQKKDKRNQNVAEIRHVLTKGMSTSETATLVGCRNHTARRIIRGDGLVQSGSPVIKTHSRDKLCPEEIQLYKDFFENKTDVRSGASTQLRQLGQSKHDLMFALFASFPSMLREIATSNQTLLQNARQTLKKTRFQIALVASQERMGLSDEQEYAIRYSFMKKKYQTKLKNKHTTETRVIVPPKPSCYKNANQTELSTYITTLETLLKQKTDIEDRLRDCGHLNRASKPLSKAPDKGLAEEEVPMEVTIALKDLRNLRIKIQEVGNV